MTFLLLFLFLSLTPLAFLSFDLWLLAVKFVSLKGEKNPVGDVARSTATHIC